MSNDQGKISSLRDLPRDIPPPKDLWREIEARIAQEPRGSAAAPKQGSAAVAPAHRGRMIAAAAVIAALALGIWIGRAVLPVPGNLQPPANEISARQGGGEPEAIPASLVMDPKYMRQRTQMLQNLQAQIDDLPPDSRAKVLSSLQTLHDSMQELEAALGKDPSNALLQELLVNTYQDEMRVLTAVNEAGDTGKGI
jgi:hypothetical protein